MNALDELNAGKIEQGKKILNLIREKNPQFKSAGELLQMLAPLSS